MILYLFMPEMNFFQNKRDDNTIIYSKYFHVNYILRSGGGVFNSLEEIIAFIKNASGSKLNNLDIVEHNFLILKI